MAAITSTLLTFLKAGDHIIFQKGLYGGTYNWVVNELEKFGVDYTIAEGNSSNDFENVLQKNTKIIYIETPSNPLLKITDIQAAADFSKANQLISVIDNTFASPVNQNPIDFGIDLIKSSDSRFYFIEINPRLTTSYIGLRNVINQNPAKLILESKLNGLKPKGVKLRNCSLFTRIELVYCKSKLNKKFKIELVHKLINLIPELLTPPISLSESN